MEPAEQIWRWRGTDGRSLEVVKILTEPHGMQVYSQYLDARMTPFSARYDWILDSDWGTRSLSVRVTQGAVRDLAIERTGAASWQIDGFERADLDGCNEIDLAITPFSNTLALRRFARSVDRPFELVALYVSFPDLVCSASRQRYEQIDGETFTYIDLGAHRGFQAGLLIDRKGFVRTYEGLFEFIEE